MAAPVATARGTPAGIKLKDGFSSLITLSSNPTVSLWEKVVQPPGIDGGEMIDQTTMHNTTWRTRAPRVLKTLTPISFTAAYDPNCLTQLNSLINVELTVTFKWADGSTAAFFGYLQKFEPDNVEEGKQPEAKCMIVPTNFDPSGKVEAGPTVVSVAGT